MLSLATKILLFGKFGHNYEITTQRFDEDKQFNACFTSVIKDNEFITIPC